MECFCSPEDKGVCGCLALGFSVSSFTAAVAAALAHHNENPCFIKKLPLEPELLLFL